MDIPLNVDCIQKLRDPPWSRVENCGGTLIAHDGSYIAAKHDLTKNTTTKNISGLKPIGHEVVFMSCSGDYFVGLMTTGDAFICRPETNALTLVRGMPEFSQERTPTDPRTEKKNPLLSMFAERRIFHDYSVESKNLAMKYNGSDSIILVRKGGVWLWQATEEVLEQSKVAEGRWSDFSLIPPETHSCAVCFADSRWHLAVSVSAPITIFCHQFSFGILAQKERIVQLPYGEQDDDLTSVVCKHCPANGARTLAVAVNFSKGNGVYSAMLLLVIPGSKSVIQTDLSRQSGGGEQIADLEFTFQGNFIVCLTKDEKIVVLTHSGIQLRTFPTIVQSGPDGDLCIATAKLNLKLMYEVTSVRIPIGRSFLSASADSSTNSFVCSNGVVVYSLKFGEGLETSMDLAEMILAKAEVALAGLKKNKEKVHLEEEKTKNVRLSNRTLTARKESLFDSLVNSIKKRVNMKSSQKSEHENERNWKEKILKKVTSGVNLDHVLYYLKHLFLQSLLLQKRSANLASGRRGVRKRWRRMTERLIQLHLICLDLELQSASDLRQSRTVMQIFQMLEAARSDESQYHLRLFCRLINGFAKTACAHKNVKASMVLLATEQMIALQVKAYSKMSKSSLKRFFLIECYRFIHDKAGASGELDVLTKIQLLFQNQGVSLLPSQVPLTSKAAMAFYKGQYSKAIFHWTQEILDPRTGPEVIERRLISILYTFFHTESFPEMLVFLNWVYVRNVRGFSTLLCHFISTVTECNFSNSVRIPLPPECAKYVYTNLPKPGESTLLNVDSFHDKTRLLLPRVFDPKLLIQLSLANGDFDIAARICKMSSYNWSNVFLVTCLSQLLSGGDKVFGLAMKVCLDQIDISRRPNELLATDMKCLVDTLGPDELESVRATVVAKIEFLLDQAESWLSDIGPLDDNDDDASHSITGSPPSVFAFANLILSISWLRVLFASGFCAPHSPACPPDAAETLGDKLYFRVIRLKFCLRLRTQFKQTIRRATKDGNDNVDGDALLELVSLGRKIHAAFPGLSGDRLRRSNLDDTLSWACLELPPARLPLTADLADVFPNADKFCSAGVRGRLEQLGLISDTKISSDSSQLILLSDGHFCQEWQDYAESQEVSGDAVIMPPNDGSISKSIKRTNDDHECKGNRLRQCWMRKDEEEGEGMLSGDRKKGLFRHRSTAILRSLGMNDKVQMKNPCNSDQDFSKIYNLPLWSKFLGIRADARAATKKYSSLFPLSEIFALCNWSRECRSFYDCDGNGDDNIMFEFDDILRILSAHEEWKRRGRRPHADNDCSEEISSVILPAAVEADIARNLEANQSRAKNESHQQQLQPAQLSTASSDTPQSHGSAIVVNVSPPIPKPRLRTQHNSGGGQEDYKDSITSVNIKEEKEKVESSEKLAEQVKTDDSDASDVINDDDDGDANPESPVAMPSCLNEAVSPSEKVSFEEEKVKFGLEGTNEQNGNKKKDEKEEHLSTATEEEKEMSCRDNSKISDSAFAAAAALQKDQGHKQQQPQQQEQQQQESPGDKCSNPELPNMSGTVKEAVIDDPSTLADNFPERTKKTKRNVSFEEAAENQVRNNSLRLLSGEELELLPSMRHHRKDQATRRKQLKVKKDKFVASLPPLLRLPDEVKEAPATMPDGYAETVTYFIKDNVAAYEAGKYDHLLPKYPEQWTNLVPQFGARDSKVTIEDSPRMYSDIQYAIRRALDKKPNDYNAENVAKDKLDVGLQAEDYLPRVQLADAEVQTCMEIVPLSKESVSLSNDVDMTNSPSLIGPTCLSPPAQLDNGESSGQENAKWATYDLRVPTSDKADQTGDSLLGEVALFEPTLDDGQTEGGQESEIVSEGAVEEEEVSPREPVYPSPPLQSDERSGVSHFQHYSSNTSGDVPSLTDYSAAMGGKEEEECSQQQPMQIDHETESYSEDFSASKSQPSQSVISDNNNSIISSTLPSDDTFKVLLDCLVREDRFPETSAIMERISTAEGLQAQLGEELLGTQRLVEVLDKMAKVNFESPDTNATDTSDKEDLNDETSGEISDSTIVATEEEAEFVKQSPLGSYDLHRQVLSRLSAAAEERLVGRNRTRKFAGVIVEVEALETPSTSYPPAEEMDKENLRRNKQLYDQVRRGVLQELESVSVSNLDLPFTNLCLKQEKLRQRQRQQNRKLQDDTSRQMCHYDDKDVGKELFENYNFVHDYHPEGVAVDDLLTVDNNLEHSFSAGSGRCVRPLRSRVGAASEVMKVPMLEDIQEISSQENSEETRVSRDSRLDFYNRQ